MKATELYRFVVDETVWRWVNGNEPITYLGEVYEPITISRSEVQQVEEINKASITVTVARDNPVGLLYLSHTPDFLGSFTLFRLEEDTEDSISPSLAAIVYWKGRVVSAKGSDDQIDLACEAVYTSLRRYGVRAKYQRSCRWPLYGRGCWLNAADFAVDGSVLGVNASVVIIPEAENQADGWWLGGMLEFAGAKRLIVSHSGSQIILARPLEALVDAAAASGYGMNYGGAYGGLAVLLYPGCKHNRTDCNTKFSNILNYGGFDWIPPKNPFHTTSLV